MGIKTRPLWLPDLDLRVWLLALGRLLSQVGIGFVLFYAPIYFVEQVGLSPTQVGLGIGIGAIAGLIGRFWGGSLTDAPGWGRRQTLLLSVGISALADGLFVLAHGFPLFVLANMVMDFGVGLYWPATEAIVADITPAPERNEAFATVRLADNIGLGCGIILGGLLISLTGFYRLLFVIDGMTFLAFFAIIFRFIAETRPEQVDRPALFHGWGVAIRDRSLLLYMAVNILLTSYVAQVHSTLPIYFNQFVAINPDTGEGLAESTLSVLFTGHVVFAALCQLPIARGLKRMAMARSLMVSAGIWAVGFICVGFAGISQTLPILWAGVALAFMAMAIVAYTPIASALMVSLAPTQLRGVYLSINSMGWALGYFVGPPIGGWALDQSQGVADGFWWGAAISVLGAIAMLAILDRQLQRRLHP